MMNIVESVREYIKTMIDKISGMKVLVLDADTVGLISMVLSQSEILQQEVFLVQRIDAEHTQKMQHLNAVCFLRPTNQNFLHLSRELKQPRYNEYHLFFTNVVPHTRLEQIAACDEHELVHQVQEFYADVYAINPDLFSLSLPSTIKLTDLRGKWTSYEESLFERIVEGLLAACLALQMRPAIRYTASSELTHSIAHRLHQRITVENSLFDGTTTKESQPVLLILDRRDDPVTPLLNQWTYQALLHELLVIENNRIDMSNVEGVRTELKEIVMSSTQDSFFAENILANFGDLGVNIKAYVEQFQEQTKNTSRIDSIGDMQRFVDEYPEFRRLSGNVSKHVAVVHELSRTIEAQGLLEASHLEQEIACSENRQQHLQDVVEILRGTKITNIERLRLVLLYALRYEHDASLSQLKDILRDSRIGDEQIGLIDAMLRYGGSQVRGGDLFQNKTLLAQARSAVTKGFKGVDNVYTQHKSHLVGLLDMLLKGRMKEASYPFVAAPEPARGRPRVIVFVVGGTTFEEARDVMELNKTLEGGRSIVLGGTTVHNSRSFLADVAQLNARVVQ